jgi:apolipoprotein N-acyltransferase
MTKAPRADRANSYAKAILRAHGEGASFAVTPDGGIEATAASRPDVLAPLLAVSKQSGIQIIAGVYQSRPHADLAISITPDGSMRQYDKRHLIPILESIFTPGHSSGWLGHGRAMEICKDMDFPGTIRRDAAKGSRLMGVPAGDFGKDAWLHARMAIMRGVEDGFALTRAADDGMVTASDAEGRLVASKLDTPSGLTMIVADLPLGPGPTLYTRIGDAFAWFCVALALLIGGYAVVIRAQPSRRQGAIENGLQAHDPRAA